MQIALKQINDPNYYGPIAVQQLGFDRKPEIINFRVYDRGIYCVDCGDVRFVAPKNWLEVIRCKPCAAKRRRQNARRSLIARGKLADSRLRFWNGKQTALTGGEGGRG
jgi:hypothetical protein